VSAEIGVHEDVRWLASAVRALDAEVLLVEHVDPFGLGLALALDQDGLPPGGNEVLRARLGHTSTSCATCRSEELRRRVALGGVLRDVPRAGLFWC
jgi:hypothetical protein